MKKFTWKDLADAINKLPEDQQLKQAFIAIDDQPMFREIVGLEAIAEDVYVNKEDNEDCATIEDLKYAHGEEFNEDDYKISTPKGTPYLIDDSNFLQ